MEPVLVTGWCVLFLCVQGGVRLVIRAALSGDGWHMGHKELGDNMGKSAQKHGG